MRTKYQALLAILLFCFAIHASAQGLPAPVSTSTDAEVEYTDLTSASWQHGAESCQSASFAAIQVQQVNANSYVLRQDKCVTFEAPFIYVLIGQDKVLVVDTGANEDPEESPIYQTIKGLIAKHNDGGDKSILVVHSHGHGDHTAGDAQFIGKPNV